ncbi:MAG TPA: DMT family transporter [Clostridiales bacterium]|nr:DMT family transporter [Clostridiales bacterium]
MKRANNKSIMGRLMLLTATIIWGSSFFILKRTIEEIPVFTLLLIRFSISFVLLLIIFAPKLKKVNVGVVAKGIIAGVPLAIAYVLQTIAIKYTTASNNAFLTATYCVMIPFLLWAIYKKRPSIYNFIAAILCIIGIGLATLQNGFEFNFMGDGLTLIAALFFALNIILIDRYIKDGTVDVIMFTAFQFIPIIIASLMGFLIQEQGQMIITREGVGGLVYLILCATIIALTFMSYGIKNTSAFLSGLIMSLEAVFGVVFAVIFSKEKLHWLTYISFVVIFISMLISEVSPHVINSIKAKKEKESNPSETNDLNLETD